MIKKTLGGDRLGSGNRMQAALHNYERSTHDLGNAWISSMAPGVLVPFYKKLCTNGDTWSINTKSLVKTIPAIGPCFGTYKLQMDFFEVPIRLYNGILHNNMTKIGMDMSKVKLPKMTLYHKIDVGSSRYWDENSQISTSSLVRYMGLSGIMWATDDASTYDIERDFNAIPILAYYDIFKNYYANKQEEYAYVIDNEVTENEYGTPINVDAWSASWEGAIANYQLTVGVGATINGNTYKTIQYIQPQQFGKYKKWRMNYDGTIGTTIYLSIVDNNLTPAVAEWVALDGGATTVDGFIPYFKVYTSGNYVEWEWNGEAGYNAFITQMEIEFGDTFVPGKWTWNVIAYTSQDNWVFETQLKPFKLENLDTMRIRILQETTLGTEFNINDENLLPYSVNVDKKCDYYSGCLAPMQGLLVKTYQSDVFNCWLSANWIDGIKGISEISAVAVEDGKIKIDALNLSKKVYNMLNRIAVSGGTYEDWQEAVYGEDALRRAESPIYCGGMSGVIAFEEVVSTADTETTNAGDQPLGSLAGKGELVSTSGGHIEIHVKEPSYIIGIVSITPHIFYSQGNDFDMTELDSLNDIHKPELDEIGFQDLMLERAAWFGHYMADQTEVNGAGGKQPAWIEYMTSVNKCYGDFAELKKAGYMVLDRRYEMGYGPTNQSKLDNGDLAKYTMVKDWTTYINPTKFNYMFADTKLNAQNFWVQIKVDAICRRKISAKLIPNL